mmetsp:Transcript_17727/g.32010  ORF Transcript_17727/g.32010 Transcript_17727/m.32010 type:complete len:157 (-) Transcript_17727:2226-2696(-)
MDFELSPWADEPETVSPAAKKPKRRSNPLAFIETAHTKLPLLAPIKGDISSALSRSIPQPPELTHGMVAKDEMDCYYKVSPIELRAKLTALADSNVHISRNKIRTIRESFVPIRRLEHLIASSIRQIHVRSISPSHMKSFVVRGSRPTLATRLKPL